MPEPISESLFPLIAAANTGGSVIPCVIALVIGTVIVITLAKLIQKSPATLSGDTALVEAAIADIVERHLDALVLERKKLLVPDKYDHIDTKNWAAELAHFTENVGLPHVLAITSESERGSYWAEYLKGLPALERYRAVKDASQDIASATLGVISAAIILAADEETEFQIAANTGNDNAALSEYKTPGEFEQWCAEQLRGAGWDAKVQGATGDQGVDVLATRNGVSLAVQCKFYSKPAGNKSVQEVVAGKQFYKCDYAAVVASSGYTPSARALALQTNVHLLHPGKLANFAPDGPP